MLAETGDKHLDHRPTVTYHEDRGLGRLRIVSEAVCGKVTSVPSLPWLLPRHMTGSSKRGSRRVTITGELPMRPALLVLNGRSHLYR